MSQQIIIFDSRIPRGGQRQPDAAQDGPNFSNQILPSVFQQSCQGAGTEQQTLQYFPQVGFYIKYIKFCLHGLSTSRPESVTEPTEKLMSPFLVEDHRSTKAGDQSLSLSPFLVQDHHINLDDMKKLMEIFIQSDFKPLGQISETGQKKPQYNYPTKFPRQTPR